MVMKKYGKGMGSGWHFESARHSLASRGIKSGRQSSYMQKTDCPSHKKSVRRVSYAKKKSYFNDYWGDEWKEGSHIHVSDGDWSIGNGTIVGFQDREKLWAIVKLDDPNADTKGYGISDKKGYVSAYKGYSYRLTKPDYSLKGYTSISPNRLKAYQSGLILSGHTSKGDIYTDHLGNTYVYKGNSQKDFDAFLKNPKRIDYYTPTYVAGDLPLIAGDAIGAAGASAVGMIPLAVTVGGGYLVAKGIKKSLSKHKHKHKHKKKSDYAKVTLDTKNWKGLSDGKHDFLFDKREISDGKKIEMEHTNNPEIAKAITKDHLYEFRGKKLKYYNELKKMEKRIKDSGKQK